jgi:hypothetical protein
MPKINFVLLTIIHIIRIMIIILSGNCPSSDIGHARINPTQGSFCAVQLFGAGTRVCSGYTATHFLRKRFTAVTDWTLS